MKAEIISIGTELLLGEIVNTNAVVLSQKLAEIGIDVYRQITVGDNRSRLAEAVETSLERSDIVITSGGLGPTVDDITIETISGIIGSKLVLNEAVLSDLKGYFKSRGCRIPGESRRQAYVPEGAKIVRNTVGTAPGLIAEHKSKVIICLPGPPRELVPMFSQTIIPYIKKISSGDWVIVSRTIKTTGISESAVNASVKDLLELKPPTTVGIYAKQSEVTLKIMAKANSNKSALRAIRSVENKIAARLKGHIFGYDSDTLEGAVGQLLTRKGLTIATAESCTGGLLSCRLTNVSGSSKYFMMGVIAYSNEWKVKLLGVPETLIEKYGAVSRQAAARMADGVRSLASASIGIGITGIAGPIGGTALKKVGLVYIAFASGNEKLVRKFQFRGAREEIKFQASQVALDMIRKNI